MNNDIKYGEWIKLRNESANERSEKLCYCGHTYKCECENPSIEEFEQSVKNGSIRIDDKENGWKLSYKQTEQK